MKSKLNAAEKQPSISRCDIDNQTVIDVTTARKAGKYLPGNVIEPYTGTVR